MDADACLYVRGASAVKTEPPDILNRTLASITAVFLAGVVLHFAVLAIAGP
jgi:hypothetical protein